jgi:energy-coupling factor transport system substrate-specific component
MIKTSSSLPSVQATEMLSLRRLVLLSLLSAAALVLQVALASFPNIELVTLWFLLLSFHITFKEGLLVVFMFTLLQALVWGIGDWVIGYLWIWTLWFLLVRLCIPWFKTHIHAWALLGAFYGFIFGLLFALQHALLYGWTMGMIYWIRGISFDIIHAFSNYSLILILFTPMNKLLKTLFRKWEQDASYNESR